MFTTSLVFSCFQLHQDVNCTNLRNNDNITLAGTQSLMTGCNARNAVEKAFLDAMSVMQYKTLSLYVMFVMPRKTFSVDLSPYCLIFAERFSLKVTLLSRLNFFVPKC